MAYIDKKTSALVNVKLTDLGRNNLAAGKLEFSKVALGDSEVHYQTNDYSLQNILRPADNQQDIMYKIPREGENYLVPIDDINSIPVVIQNAAEERGFFTTGGTLNSELFKVFALEVNINTLSGATKIYASSFSGTTYSGTTASTVNINEGDLVILKGANKYYGTPASPDGVDNLPYFMYEVTTTISGYTGGSITINVDRDVARCDLSDPTSTGVTYIYVLQKNASAYYAETPAQYWSTDYLDFTTNYSDVDDNVKIWNMNIIHLTDMIGVNDLYYKGSEDSVGNKYSGIYTYLQYAKNNPTIKSLGVIHYSNNSVNNYYGEGILPTNFELKVPTLMWHKKQFSGVGTANEIGYTFVCDDELKRLNNIVRYYDLVDQETTPTVVGKMFPDLKIVVIEHPELLMAMSLKSNRNWTLPKPTLTLVEAGICPTTSDAGILTSGESLHVSYILSNSSGSTNGGHCLDYSTITCEEGVKDVLFQFPKKATSPSYNEFPYYKNVALNGEGWSAENMIMLIQKTTATEQPTPDGWKYFNCTRYIGGDGCVATNIQLDAEVELYKQTFIVTDPNQLYYYLNYEPIGDIVVTVNGLVLNEATSTDYIFDLDPSHPDYGTFSEVMGGYRYVSNDNAAYFAVNKTYYPNLSNETLLQVGDTVQLHYLRGSTNSAATIKQSIFVPSPIPSGASGDIYLDTPLSSGVTIAAPSPCLDLDDVPVGTVYVFYNGQLLSGSNYFVVENTGVWRVELDFIPAAGSTILLYFLSGTVAASGQTTTVINGVDLNLTRVYLNKDIYTQIASTEYAYDNFITIPDSDTTERFSFGDEELFFGNVATDIKATIYKSKMLVKVLPNWYIESNNPTFNSNLHTVAISEVGIYDNDDDLVAIGKFSQPLQRNNNSDLLVINVTLDI